ncbi:MAG: hypothetical protein AAFX05_10090 [Planctomycetota bacterium]
MHTRRILLVLCCIALLCAQAIAQPGQRPDGPRGERRAAPDRMAEIERKLEERLEKIRAEERETTDLLERIRAGESMEELGPDLRRMFMDEVNERAARRDAWRERRGGRGEQGPGGGQGDRPRGRGDGVEAALEGLDPDMRSTLENVIKRNPERAREFRQRFEDNPERAKTHLRLISTEVRVRRIAQALRKAEDANRIDLEAQLRDTLSEQFDLRIEVAAYDVADLESRLDELRSRLDDASEKRDSMIEQRMSDILEGREPQWPRRGGRGEASPREGRSERP